MWLDFLIVVALILANGLFAGAEIAVLTIRRSQLQVLTEEGRPGASAVQALRAQPERFLATVQIGITVVSAAAAAFGGAAIADRLAESLTVFGVYADEVAFGLVVAVISYLSLVLGELVPKSLALRKAVGYATLVGRPLVFLSQLARPLVWLLTVSSNAVLRLFGDRTTFTEARLSPAELQELVEEAGKVGALDPQSSEIASRAISFEEVTVGEVMIPRSEIVALPLSSSVDEIRRILLERGHSRMPVYDGTLDHVVGYVVAKDLFALAWERELIVLQDLLRPVYVVPETARAPDVLKELQRRRTQIAVVVDEHGLLIGLVSVEDLVEELVGEIFSEHEAERVRREPDGAVLVHGAVPVREVNRDFDLELPEGEGFTTVAGLVLHEAQAIPPRGARFRLADGTTLEVVDATPRRIVQVRVRPPAKPGQA